MDEIQKTLEDLGFEKREVKIYLTLIKSNSETALEISKATKIDRTTIYDLLNKLMHEGFVSSMKKNNSTYFKAISVTDLLLHFQDKINSLEAVSEKLKELENKEKDEVGCELFIGLEGLKTVFRDLLNSKKNYKVIGIKKKYEEILEYFNEQGIVQINANKISEEAIVNKDEKFVKTLKGKYHYLEKGLNAEVTMVIYGEIVLFFIWKEPYFAIRIKNQEFSKAQEEYFCLISK
ncbi:hypothetical protein J4474_00270 [Candidatus Pacearchaeota archaeon]|nr:hypothetical protein [Candidatus Pacearchaeota archaeon]